MTSATNRFSYFKADYPSVFSFYRKWMRVDKPAGCKPLANPQAAILMEKKPPALPGEKPPVVKKPEKAKADPESGKNQKSAQPIKVSKAQNKGTPVQSIKVSNNEPKSKELAEECKIPPPFDMLDIPDAMEQMAFLVAAKLARRWFNGRKHVITDDPTYVYPTDMVDTTILSLDYILKNKKVKSKYDELINNDIYNGFSSDAIKEKMQNLAGKKFIDEGIAYSGELDALAHAGGDIQSFHKLFQFQRAPVSSFDSLDGGFGLNDLIASLANFNLMAAVANARVYSEKYYNYSKTVPVFCCQSTVEVTHIYIYVRDSYSFLDKKNKKASQYLGHWNRNGVILVPAAVASDFANGRGFDAEWANSPYDASGFDKPVDTLKGLFGAMRKQDVYYPVHNRDYSAWREKFNRGGDFAIYTKPLKVKLPKPVKFALDETCRPVK
jgi:hypothetical protein